MFYINYTSLFLLPWWSCSIRQFSRLLWLFHLKHNCIKYFACVFFPLNLVLSFICFLIFIFSRIDTLKFHVLQYFDLIKLLSCLKIQWIWTKKLVSKHYMALCKFCIANTYIATSKITEFKRQAYGGRF
jgi:hypothetical protein